MIGYIIKAFGLKTILGLKPNHNTPIDRKEPLFLTLANLFSLPAYPMYLFMLTTEGEDRLGWGIIFFLSEAVLQTITVILLVLALLMHERPRWAYFLALSPILIYLGIGIWSWNFDGRIAPFQYVFGIVGDRGR